jgi:NAD(P)-dependent dehydrogenase (short-subunit alcohol dehydrogenase family)
MSIKGKKAWIVGATGVIGSAIAQRFREEGAIVSATRVDVRNDEEISKIASFIRPNILVNCSGIIGDTLPTMFTEISEWRKVIEVNLLGGYYLTRCGMIPMIEAGGGKIIHFGGGGACEGRPNYSAYATSKAGLLRFVETVAEELEPYNIQVNAIAPGPVKSKMNPDATGTPDAAVELALYLASDECKLTGRLISAIHDNWRDFDLVNPEAGKLRRISFGAYKNE